MIDVVRPTQLYFFETLAPIPAPVSQSPEYADPVLQRLALELVYYLLPILSQPKDLELVAAQCHSSVLSITATLVVLFFAQVAYQ